MDQVSPARAWVSTATSIGIMLSRGMSMDRSDWITDLGWAREDCYAQAMEQIVLPYLRGIRRDTQVSGYGARPLMCAQYDAQDPRGTVLILHGFTECIEKYAEVVYAFLTAHYSVVIYDQRGHGQSWRAEGLSDPSVTHVDSFSDYVVDMERVCVNVLHHMPRPWIVFAHSMGGAVAAFYLEKHKNTFDKAILCAPMIAPHRSGAPYLLTRLMCRVANATGKKKKRAFITKPYAGREKFETSCATSRARFDWFEDMRAQNPHMQNNGP
ncbi:MAG: alpha/beta hydrolase, partial [Clostridiales bacterium]|nr:alpha/beta hydrolase [Clostridiales bacterium]